MWLLVVAFSTLSFSRSITFFCEVQDDDIPQFAPQAIQSLLTLNASVSLAIRNLSETRANLVKLFNTNGIPVSAWLLVDREQGYWANVANAEVFFSRYEEFKKWTKERDLTFKSVGLDLEFDLVELEQLQVGNWSYIWSKVFRRSADVVTVAQNKFKEVVHAIRRDGYTVESYIIPIILDERAAKSHFLQRVTGIVDVGGVDVEVPMLYSVMMPLGLGMMKSYSSEILAIGIGSTGSPASVGSTQKYSEWHEFKRDLLLVSSFNISQIYIYSLEGAFENGYLEEMISLNWSESISDLQQEILEVEFGLVSSLRLVMLGMSSIFLKDWVG
eukprot:TRINITY_DN1129_c0_g1_i2.p1 TRINITY_DN1129_c0_g1~~TRINITY_DN1129_c0_g1_i2.p1  ORF type:complete len:329 (-),score=44.21 TRINITY_DN1129_c0_g1_i2:1407-2393(-)